MLQKTVTAIEGSKNHGSHQVSSGRFSWLCVARTIPQTTMTFGKKWGSLLRYAAGYIGCMPLRQLFLDENEKRMNDKVFISDVLTAVTFGGGVFLGYLFDKEE
jgi:hypothetical protein